MTVIGIGFWYTQNVLTGEARTRGVTRAWRRSAFRLGFAVVTVVALTPATGFAAALACAEADVSGLRVRAVVSAAGFGDTGAEPRLPVSMSIANHSGRELRFVEARQALDGALTGAVIADSPVASHGGVEYDSRGLMWQGDLTRNQVAAVTYALTAPPDSEADRVLRGMRPGARLDTTITSTSAECG